MKVTLQKILDAGFERDCGNDTFDIFERIRNGSRMVIIYNSEDDVIVDQFTSPYTEDDFPTSVYDDGGGK